MSYTFEELDMIAEALNLLIEQNSHRPRRVKALNELADKVVKDQSNKSEA